MSEPHVSKVARDAVNAEVDEWMRGKMTHAPGIYPPAFFDLCVDEFFRRGALPTAYGVGPTTIPIPPDWTRNMAEMWRNHQSDVVYDLATMSRHLIGPVIDQLRSHEESIAKAGEQMVSAGLAYNQADARQSIDDALKEGWPEPIPPRLEQAAEDHLILTLSGTSPHPGKTWGRLAVALGNHVRAVAAQFATATADTGAIDLVSDNMLHALNLLRAVQSGRRQWEHEEQARESEHAEGVAPF